MSRTNGLALFRTLNVVKLGIVSDACLVPNVVSPYLITCSLSYPLLANHPPTTHTTPHNTTQHHTSALLSDLTESECLIDGEIEKL